MSTGDCAVRGTIAGLSGMTEVVVNPMTVRLYPLAAEHVAAMLADAAALAPILASGFVPNQINAGIPDPPAPQGNSLRAACRAGSITLSVRRPYRWSCQ